MNTTNLELQFDPALLQARLVLYRFASLTLLDPRAGAWEQLSALKEDPLLTEASKLIQEDPAAEAAELGCGERPLKELDPVNVLSALPSDPAELNRQFEAVFGLLVSCAASPYETEYINGKFAIQRSHTLGDVSGFYTAFGLQPAANRIERHDHVVLELEFMAFLLGKENQAVEREQIEISQKAQQRFFVEHLSWWTPAFAHLLAREAGDGYYGRAAHFLAALITSDRARYGLPVPSKTVQPSQLELPEACEGCGLEGE